MWDRRSRFRGCDNTRHDKRMKEQAVNITGTKDRNGKNPDRIMTLWQERSIPAAGRSFPDIPVRKLRIATQR